MGKTIVERLFASAEVMRRARRFIAEREFLEAGVHIQTLETELATMREALAWYGDEGNYSCKPSPTNNPDIDEIEIMVMKDRGQRARDSIRQREVKDAG